MDYTSPTSVSVIDTAYELWWVKNFILSFKNISRDPTYKFYPCQLPVLLSNVTKG